MAGAIFMSNSETRDHCFNTGVFGLPPEYGPFVANVKQGMPLFLFDYTFRKLYGVFEAASDGGMDISRTAFRSTGRTYPAQVIRACHTPLDYIDHNFYGSVMLQPWAWETRVASD